MFIAPVFFVIEDCRLYEKLGHLPSNNVSAQLDIEPQWY